MHSVMQSHTFLYTRTDVSVNRACITENNSWEIRKYVCGEAAVASKWLNYPDSSSRISACWNLGCVLKSLRQHMEAGTNRTLHYHWGVSLPVNGKYVDDYHAGYFWICFLLHSTWDMFTVVAEEQTKTSSASIRRTGSCTVRQGASKYTSLISLIESCMNCVHVVL